MNLKGQRLLVAASLFMAMTILIPTLMPLATVSGIREDSVDPIIKPLPADGDKEEEKNKEEREPPLPPPSPCSLILQGFPERFVYEGRFEDVREVSDLLDVFAGEAGPNTRAAVVMLGGPYIKSIRFWMDHGIKFFRSGKPYYNAIDINGTIYKASEGKDYAVVSQECRMNIIRIGGATERGTRAGLMWLLENPDMFERYGRMVLLEWEDSNGDGQIDLWEISINKILG